MQSTDAAARHERVLEAGQRLNDEIQHKLLWLLISELDKAKAVIGSGRTDASSAANPIAAR